MKIYYFKPDCSPNTHTRAHMHVIYIHKPYMITHKISLHMKLVNHIIKVKMFKLDTAS